ncbi:heat shock protein beta-1 isoform X2 [Folsomia candida]|uniref:heat shock protein beta-1 isoform X2 n=1 Tax=Folsomia candida TaxID=158441 RepID=UPI000B9034AE|nr:heat shock protein beta-1 isoform X2 [Folsomia candida]
MDKRIPVKLSDSSVLDTEFSSIRERFDAEMRRMEDEMSNFRTQLIQRQENFFSNKSSNQLTQQQQQGNVLEGLSSPLIQEDGGDKTLKLRFDVSQYAPEEIVLKTIDNKLLVHAKHEEKSETKSVYREYNREFLLPSGVNPELIRSSLSKDGVLTVEAPLPQALQGGGAQQAIKF